MKKGKVVLVGAGPGDKRLLTLKAAEAIQECDVVIYDALVSENILSLISGNVEKINVGKSSGNHLMSQKKINELLLEKALKGKYVVRLKGGDPFVFGRGGEELVLLKENGISFEVVPGITSAIGAPMYGGIPVTHRDYASSFHVIIAHYKERDTLSINFKALVALEGTLVFLMGVESLAYIGQGLIEAGMSKKMPVAIIEKGTTARQRQFVSTLEDLENLGKRESIKAPSCIVVGSVCTLSEDFNWFSKKPLFGKKIIVTRPEMGEGKLAKKLRNLGADVLEYPCIQIEKSNANFELVSSEIENINVYKWLVFTSKNGVDFFFENLFKKKLDVRILGSIKIAVVGPQTNHALMKYGLKADILPTTYNGETLGVLLQEIVDKHEKVLIMRAALHGKELTEYLEQKEIQYKDVPIYETHYFKQENNPTMLEYVKDKATIVAFTSGSTVDGFMKNIEGENIDTNYLKCVCIGPMTEEKAKGYGFNPIVSEEATINSLVAKIEEMSCEENGIN